MRNLVVILLSISLIGCTTLSPRINSSMWAQARPLVKYEKNSKVDLSLYENFTVFAQAELNKDYAIDPIIEAQLLFMLRNHFEILGYNYVSNLQDADFFISVYHSNEYTDRNVNPSLEILPEDIALRTKESFIDNYDNIPGYLSDYFDILRVSPPAQEVKEEPEQETVSEEAGDSKDKQSQNDKGYYSSLVYLSVIDKNLKDIVFSAAALRASFEPDIRLAAQSLFRSLLWGEEPAISVSTRLSKGSVDSGDGSIGIFPYIQTSDGRSFYPLIGKVYLDSPSFKEGLRPGDIITYIDGESMLNRSFSQCLAALNKNKGQSLAFVIKRGEEVIDIKVVAEDEEVAQKNWRKYIAIKK